MTRDEMIKELIDDDINGWYDRDDKDAFFSYIMLNGWTGYKTQSDEELMEECFNRGILDDTHPSFDPVLKNEV
jgi:hypothetical protein